MTMQSKETAATPTGQPKAEAAGSRSAASVCCGPAEQNTCCEPVAKAACCDASHPGGCGCK